MVSGMYFSGVAPFRCVKAIPTSAATLSNAGNEFCTAISPAGHPKVAENVSANHFGSGLIAVLQTVRDRNLNDRVASAIGPCARRHGEVE